jgi:hypothetical protein
MKFPFLLTTALLATISFANSLKAQESPRDWTFDKPSIDGTQVLQVCTQDQADTLPNPFSDVPSTHWAYKAVMSMYYCGAYRGSIPPEQVEQSNRSPLMPTNRAIPSVLPLQSSP